MGTISPAKTAGYCLILGPIIALICFFLQPGGVLGIGGSPEALDFAEGMRIQVENSELGIITSFLITLGLVSLLSGQMYYIQSMQDGNGFGIGRVAIPFFFVAVFGWVIANAIGISTASEVLQSTDILALSAAINTTSLFSFGVGGLFLALAASTRDEVNKNITYVAGIAAVVVFVLSLVGAFAPDQSNSLQAIAGLCFIIYSIWSILIGRAIISK